MKEELYPEPINLAKLIMWQFSSSDELHLCTAVYNKVEKLTDQLPEEKLMAAELEEQMVIVEQLVEEEMMDQLPED